MTENERRFTAVQSCPHCGVDAPMEILGTHGRIRQDAHERDGSPSNRSGVVYELLLCPICEEATLRSHIGSPQLADLKSQTLYPATEHPPAQIPDSFKPAYATVCAFRKMDPVSYGIMLGHLTAIRECNRKRRL